MSKIPKSYWKYMPAKLKFASEADQLEWYECYKRDMCRRQKERYHREKDDPELREKRRAYSRDYYHRNRERLAEKRRADDLDPEKLERKRQKAREYREKNCEKINAYQREYRQENATKRMVKALQAKVDAGQP